MLNKVQFTYKRSAELLALASINQYGKFKILYEITHALEQHGVLQDFTATCFGHFLNFDSNTLFSSKMVHSLLAREIIVDGVREFELYFGIDRRRLRFSEDEPFFQPITIVLSKVVSFRGIGQMGKLMSQTYRINYASKVQGLSIERIH